MMSDYGKPVHAGGLVSDFDLSRCERADVIGYNLAQGQTYVDCKLANTGGDLLTPVLIFVVLLVVGGLLLLGAWAESWRR